MGVLRVVGRAARIALVLVVAALGMMEIILLLALEALIPSLETWCRPAREAVVARQHHHFRSVVRHPFQTLVVGALLGLVLINGAVRWTGGRPHLLSIHHLSDKSVALLRLAAHMPFHPLRSCSGDPDALMQSAARAHRLPPALLRAVVRTESGFRPHVISHAGAMGVMQLMPATAREMGVWDPFDARESLDGGARYLAYLRKRYRGDLRRTVAAYHAGPRAVPVKGALRVGPTTRRYVKVVLQRYRKAKP